MLVSEACIFGIGVLASMSEESVIKGFLAALIGVGVSTIGLDPLSGISRSTFGNVHLLAGTDPVLVMVGVPPRAPAIMRLTRRSPRL